ncbi:MAG: WYL domain-containing protein [Candidatus Promineofilum sp.]|nr:WYL domain-containing protein [Promineifilum sp.]MCW5863503.1 WYL domain-containing protein [Anaerolineae bacterium]
MSRGMSRAARLREEEMLYIQRAFSDQEMADRMGVTRSTIWKDRETLRADGVPLISDERGRWRIDRSRYLSAVRLNLYEALSLYLAARRASRQTQTARQHAASALSKLATALHQPMARRLVDAAESVHQQQPPIDRTKVIETVARAWAEHIPLNIEYERRRGEPTKRHRVKPYLIEPSQWSDSVYLIGHSDLSDDIIPFKIERIVRASLGSGSFELPTDLDEQRLLRHAWGIWYTDHEPEMVRLQFASGMAAQRLRESVWHPLETVNPTADGGCLWSCPVDEWREMLPWVRGWGADVTVLAPEEMRREMTGEARRLAECYGWRAHRGDEAPVSPSLDQTFRDFFGDGS